MLRVFIGYDERQPLSYNVAQFSIIRKSKTPVAITPIIHSQVSPVRTGLTPFTFTRFLVPAMCDYDGWALFIDCDVILNADITELFDKADDKYSVMVCKGNAPFEHAAVVLMNCKKLKMLTPEFINTENGLHKFKFLSDSEIGDLGKEWGYLVGYEKDPINAKLIHYTQGIPAFPETLDSPMAVKWLQEKLLMNYSVPWEELMGQSVHATAIDYGTEVRKIPNFVADSMRARGLIK